MHTFVLGDRFLAGNESHGRGGMHENTTTTTMMTTGSSRDIVPSAKCEFIITEYAWESQNRILDE